MNRGEITEDSVCHGMLRDLSDSRLASDARASDTVGRLLFPGLFLSCVFIQTSYGDYTLFNGLAKRRANTMPVPIVRAVSEHGHLAVSSVCPRFEREKILQRTEQPSATRGRAATKWVSHAQNTGHDDASTLSDSPANCPVGRAGVGAANTCAAMALRRCRVNALTKS
jgi:hypothetical protein